MTRLVCLSDTHHKHYYIDLPPGDILIHAGDFMYRGERMEQSLVKEWLTYISLKYKHVVFISGNHDINFSPVQTSGMLPDNCYHLHDSKVALEGINFYGSAYTPRFGDWGWGESEEKLAVRFNHIPKSTDVLITHGPPRSILDTNKDGLHCGSVALYEKIKKLPGLKHHIFGHIHESFGEETVADTKFHNVSILDEFYEIKNPVTIIDYE